MKAQFNHTIVWARDPKASAEFLAGILGLGVPTTFHQFWVVDFEHGASLDFMASEDPISAQHYAFLVSEDAFDKAMAYVKKHGVTFWDDQHKSRQGKINTRDGGRGFYFDDPSGHFMEIITRPYARH